MPQSEYNLAQIDMMVRTIQSLKEEANQVHSTNDDNDTPTTPVPQLIITSRPKGSMMHADESTNLDEEDVQPSADIISIMDRISALAADGEDALQQSTEQTDAPNIGALLTRIHSLLDEANDIEDDLTSSTDDIAFEIAPISDAAFAPEPHKLDDTLLEAGEVDAAMQDIETAVRNAAPVAAVPSEAYQHHTTNTDQIADSVGDTSVASNNLKDMIRDEVHSVLKAELPDAVRTIVRKTLQDEGYSPPQREKIRTRRFRNS